MVWCIDVFLWARLQSRSGRAPSSYVQYTLPLQPTAFTSTVARSADPLFNDTRKFTVIADAAYLSLLKDNQVQFVLFDDDQRDVSGVGSPYTTAFLDPWFHLVCP